MNLDDMINKQNRRQDEIRKQPPPDEEEETYTYAVRKKTGFINDSEGGIFDIKKQTGINTAKSVFDKGIFRTGN
jgi:hypothetical protein